MKYSTQLFLAVSISGIILNSSQAFAAASCYSQVNDTFDKVQKCLTLEGVVRHLKAFQKIADNNADLPGSRFTNTRGYTDSVNYIVEKLADAGYKVSIQDVPLKVSYITSPDTFELNLPEPKTLKRNIDFVPLAGSAGGDLTAAVQAPENADGCDIANFNKFEKGNVALLSYGACSTTTLVTNAMAAGASAIIIASQTPDVYFYGFDLSLPKNVPMVITSSIIADKLKMQIESGTLPKVHFNFHAVIKDMNSQNIIAETQEGNADKIIMAGTHLDSGTENSGMNDNASSSAALLETALVMQKTKPVNKLRFAWWTGEELGLLGSTYYVEHLQSGEKAKIAVYLNTEILGAANGARLIMDAKDGVTSPGSEKVVQVYADYFKSQNLKYYAFDPEMGSAVKRSDMYGFIQAGIPTGYIVSGANIPWNPLLSMIFTDLPNRKDGVMTHPCYHLTCDKLTLDETKMTDPNFDFDLYLQMTKAQAYAIYTYAMNVS